MSEAHVEIVQRIYRAWGNGEQAEARELLHADIEWVNPPHAIEPGTRKGIDAFVEALEMVADTFDGPKLESEEFREVGGHVVVIGVLHGRGQSSGIAVERRRAMSGRSATARPCALRGSTTRPRRSRRPAPGRAAADALVSRLAA